MILSICSNSDILKVVYLIKIVVTCIQIAVPIMLTVLIMLDFSKGVKDAKAPGEILQTCKYRIIAAIVIFAIPLLVKIILNVMGNSTFFSACWNSANSTSIKIAENEYKEKEEIQENNKNKSPVITSITKDGAIITIKVQKNEYEIKGYYFSYNNKIPNKETGGYLETNKTSIDVVRLIGTTYVWVEDTNGKISEYKTINISSSDIPLTANNNYTILKGTALSTYLQNQGWSLEELNNLMARSVRAAGLYTKEAVATSALSLTHVLAQKYKIKIPYQSAGIHKVPGAKDKWGASNSRAEKENEKYYGMDCSAFANWVYANAGFGINSRVYYWGSSVPRIEYSQSNGDIGDVLVYGVGSQSGRHVRLIIGKTETEFLIAEASGSGVAITTQKYSKSGGYQIQKADFLIDTTKNKDYYLNTNYPSGF